MTGSCGHVIVTWWHRSLESELLLLGSYHLLKCGMVKGAKRGVKTESDVEKLACFQVDRFAILLDLWTCEEQYQQTKKKVSVSARAGHCLSL